MKITFLTASVAALALSTHAIAAEPRAQLTFPAGSTVGDLTKAQADCARINFKSQFCQITFKSQGKKPERPKTTPAQDNTCAGAAVIKYGEGNITC